MIDLPMDTDQAHPGNLGWQADNERGLALAADFEWAEAAEAFAGAADTLARVLPANAGAHEPLALVLGNLAQAYFRDGRVDDAIQQAQRTCALRVALAGEDGMPVARARMDLAVMLAAAGRVGEAMALVQRAIASIEHRVGDEDARLAIVLENAARIALAAGAPANAEPLLLRLHALLDSHGLSTVRAEQLLARISAVRARQADEAAGGEHIAQVATPDITPRTTPTVAPDATPAAAPTAPPDTPMATTGDEFSAYLDASLLPDEEWEDQPLRDAVALTDVLLRTTPSGVPAIAETSGAHAATESPSDELALDLADAFDVPQHVPSIDDVSLLDFDLQPTEAAQPDAERRESSRSSTPSGADDIDLDLTLDLAENDGLDLGFAVEHGATNAADDAEPHPSTPAPAPVHNALTAPLLSRPVEYVPSSSQPSFPEPTPLPAEPPSPIRRVDITHAAPVTAPPVAPLADIVSTAPPSASEPVLAPRSGADEPRPASQQTNKARTETSNNKALSRSSEPSGSSKMPFIIGGVLAVGGAAAWFLLR